MAVADSLQRAAATFTDMAIEHKKKDDALSYSNAKNEYLIADIQEREKLRDDQDFATHDERYRTAMAGHYERLFPTVRSSRDRLLFDAEARLMNERGSVAVGENSRTKEIDWNLGQFNDHLTKAQGVIMAAQDAQTAQDAMFSVLEQGAALRERGYLTETEYQAKMQGFVTDTAFARLVAMDPKMREVLLERSITMTKTNGEPITREQIAAGEGSDSIADFLPLDVRVKMLEETRKGNEHDMALDDAYQVFDEITAVHKDPNKVGAAAREAGKGMDSKARANLNTLVTQYQQAAAREETAEEDDILTRGSAMIDQDMNPELAMQGGDWEKLQEFQKKALRDSWEAKQEGREFGKFNVYSRPTGEEGMSYALWKSIPREQRVAVTLESPEWKMSFTPTMWAQLKAEQDTIQKELDGSKPAKLPSGMTNQQLIQAALVRSGDIPQTGRSDAEQETYYSALAAMDYRTQVEQERLGRALTNEERRKVMVDMMVDKAFTDRDFLWFDDDYDPGEQKPVALMSAKERRIAFLPIADARKEGGYVDPDTGIPMTVEAYLIAAGKRGDFGEVVAGPISQKNMERAYFALERLSQIMSPAEVDAEILRRLKGE